MTVIAWDAYELILNQKGRGVNTSVSDQRFRRSSTSMQALREPVVTPCASGSIGLVDIPAELIYNHLDLSLCVMSA